MGDGVIRWVGINGRQIRYTLHFAETQYLSVSVEPDLSVSVVAPEKAEMERVDERVLARVGWIVRQQRRFERYHPLPVPRRYVGGETHLYLGRQYRLRVRRGAEAVKLSGGFLWVTTPRRASRRRIEALVKAWYRHRAEQVVPRRLDAVLRQAPWLGRPEPRVRLREMSRRWGSCGAKGTVSMNVELIKAPVSCLDYVLVHELCHRIELNHSRRFYRLLRRAMPGWERARERLNSLLIA